jgi:hypothetical protein
MYCYHYCHHIKQQTIFQISNVSADLIKLFLPVRSASVLEVRNSCHFPVFEEKTQRFLYNFGQDLTAIKIFILGTQQKTVVHSQPHIIITRKTCTVGIGCTQVFLHFYW